MNTCLWAGVVNVEAESNTSKDVSWCQCIFVCECVCERLYFLDKNTVLPLNKTLVSRPYREKWTVIKEPETLTRHQGCRKNITRGLIQENLNNIICAAFINSLSSSALLLLCVLTPTCLWLWLSYNTDLWHSKPLFCCIYMKPGPL